MGPRLPSCRGQHDVLLPRCPERTGGEGDTTRSHPPPTDLGGGFGTWRRFFLLQIPHPRAVPGSFGASAIASTPGSGGSLSLNGGWLLFLVDACGVWMFGDWWPTVATGCCLVVMLAPHHHCALDPSLGEPHLVLPCLGCLRRRCCRRSSSVDLAGVRAADTEFYQREVRGRGTNRRPHDLVVVMDAGVVRLQLDPERRTRIDRHGLWVHPSRVLGATTRRVWELVETTYVEGQIAKGPWSSLLLLPAVDAEALVDLGAYDRVTAWRLGVLAWVTLHLLGSRHRPMDRVPPTSSFIPTECASADPGTRCTEVIGPGL